MSAAKVKCLDLTSKTGQAIAEVSEGKVPTIWKRSLGKEFAATVTRATKFSLQRLQYVIFSAPLNVLYSTLYSSWSIHKHPLQCVAQPLGYERSPTTYYHTKYYKLLLRTTTSYKVLQSITPYHTTSKCWLLQIATANDNVLQSTTRLYKVLQSTTSLFKVLQSTTLRTTKIHRVLQRSTTHYSILKQSTPP